jgi:ABC-type dipeptide/oligopeptide/nickel transport system permease subunit
VTASSTNGRWQPCPAAILIISLAFNLIADSLRDILDPRHD